MRRVIVESPYAGDIERNVAYAKECVLDCLRRGEAPIASHLLFTQPGLLKDAEPMERKQGMEAGWAWYPAATAIVFYVDHGISGGMLAAIETAQALQRPVEFRKLYT